MCFVSETADRPHRIVWFSAGKSRRIGGAPVAAGSVGMPAADGAIPVWTGNRAAAHTLTVRRGGGRSVVVAGVPSATFVSPGRWARRACRPESGMTPVSKFKQRER